MTIVPTIGRKVWYWPVGDASLVQYDENVACDATVIYPWSDTNVNLRVTDHAGNTQLRTSVFLHQGKVDDRPASSCATWMPFQMGQVKALNPA